MDQTIFDENCEETCAGSNLDVVQIRSKMLPEDTVISLSDIFKALGDPTRIRLIYTLLQKELCVHDLTEVLNMGQSAVSHQLRYLRNLRIVKRRKVGKTVYYSLDDAHVEQLFQLALQHIGHE